MTLLTQTQLEERMIGLGASRAKNQMDRAEAEGEASRNPYAATLFREFVEPLQAIIQRDCAATGPGQRGAHVKLLKALDPWSIAYIAVRTCMNTMFSGGGALNTTRKMGYSIGKMVHCELYLAQFDNLTPDLYHHLSEELGRRRSQSVEHKMKVFKSEAGRQGLDFVEWPIGAREQVGMYLMDCLIALGMLDMQAPPAGPGKRQELLVTPAQAVAEVVARIRGFVELTRPVFGPCVEPPRDWVALDDGGFHTPRMRRGHPFMVKCSSTAREALRTHEMPVVYSAINHLQKTPWRVNARVLEVVQEVGRFRNTGEILTIRDESKPPAPTWLAYHEKGAPMTPAQEAEFQGWKSMCAAWYTQQKLDSAKFRRYYGAISTAEFYKDYPELYFVWFADSRGRLYPLTQGISPQGSDLQKGLLTFAHGKALGNDDGIKWFLINGANKFGYDKEWLSRRRAWHLDHQDVILAVAADPVNNLFWTEADNPVQFLAWCLEYAEFQKCADPYAFVSRIPVALDGSCNGLQHYSAMLRDEVGGRAVNLTANKDMADIYRQVSEVAYAAMKACGEDSPSIALWLRHGFDRSLSKRSVMTTPYGVTKRSAVKYVIEDYLMAGKAPCFSRDMYYAAANTAMDFIWPAIGKVVVKAREAMDWLRLAGRQLGKASEDGVVYWPSASGFLASQTYYEQEEHMIRTKLFGHARIKVVSEAPETSADRHATAMAPNFVHSCDAAHLHVCTVALAAKGVNDLAMIHDDYGSHAADAEVLFHTIRSTFYGIYSTINPLEVFKEYHTIENALPALGSLNLEEVLVSDYFFS